MKIDAVITWVDGNDPAHRERMKAYGSKADFSRDDVAGSTRYASVGEIFWCVASINRFAPFVNKIYIITDGQDPRLDVFLDKNFPEGHIPVEIVDHRTVFRGYERFLPVFNSLAIESVMWRIPGLSEHFLYFNDDIMLAAPVTPGDFFTEDGGIVCYADRYSVFFTDLTRALKTIVHRGQRQVTFKGMLRNSVRAAGGGGYFLHYGHSPKALLKSFFEDFFASREDVLLGNIGHRFRSPDQFCPEEVQILCLYRSGRCEVRSLGDRLFFFQMKDRPGYPEKKLRALEKGNYVFCCFNSLDKTGGQVRERIVSWVCRRLDIEPA